MEPLLRLEGIGKSYGAVTALDGIDLELYPSEVLALIGDNGAGKSTLVKIVAGAIPADRGRIFFEGREVRIQKPDDARALGIETVYQDLSLFENSSIAENIFAGREPVRRLLGLPILKKREMHREARRIVDDLHIPIHSTRALVRGLSGGQRQSVAIGRAVAFSRQVLILDEPTAALGVPEQRKVLALVRELRDKGFSIVLISHNLEQVFTVADRLHVLRQGRTAGVVRRDEATPDQIVKLITGLDQTEAAA
jgi:ABC-type sugar transport system ATPase subunit